VSSTGPRADGDLEPAAQALRRWTRRLGVLVAVIAGVLGLNLIAAPPAQAFNIFDPVKHAVQDAFNSFLDQLAHAIRGSSPTRHGILGYADRAWASTSPWPGSRTTTNT
jgi:hypothetical protein